MLWSINTESKDEQSYIKTLEIYKSTDGGQTRALITVDDYGLTVSIDEFFYAFRTSVLKSVIIPKAFGVRDSKNTRLRVTLRNPIIVK